MRLTILAVALALVAACANAQTASNVTAQVALTNVLGLATNPPAVFQQIGVQWPPSDKVYTNRIFQSYLPESLNYAVWTNVIARTNGRTTVIWSERSHPPGWPTNRPPIVAWNTNSLLWGMKGMTGISPCWEDEGSTGQCPVTALTRRHGYTRGHGMGPEGFTKNRKGKKVWFVTRANKLVEVTVLREVVRTRAESKQDYTLLLFNADLPETIEPMRVARPMEVFGRYRHRPPAPWPMFKTEQLGRVSADLPGFYVETWKGGDSGSPDMLPLGNELVFFNGRSTSGPGPEMQADIDTLCRLERLDPKKYQLQWFDLSAYPTYPVQ